VVASNALLICTVHKWPSALNVLEGSSMALDYVDLDAAIREWMVKEINLDILNAKMNPSPWLTGSGLLEWPSLLLDAARYGNDISLTAQLRLKRRLNATQLKKKRSGEMITCNMPDTAPETLTEREFNRFYIRAICRRAISKRVHVIIYRAKSVGTPRAASQQNIGCTLDPSALLEAIRSATQADTTAVFGLLGPNSGLSVRLP
jgi:hypothetical protein